MLSVKELHRIAKAMKPAEFQRQLGPFALVQRPPSTVAKMKSLQLGAKRTMIATKSNLKDELSLLFEFDDLMIATLPTVDSGEPLSVGRAPDCDLVVDDPSVSKHHASLFWDAPQHRVLIEDHQSSNGTQLNGEAVNVKMGVKDGDTLSFGDT